jgi:putative flavoprotein involved in K+ transport
VSVEKFEVVVVGGGQAGLAMSAHLQTLGVPHMVLERARIAERWRSERWDSLVANGPCWHDRYPGLDFPGHDPEEFVAKEKVADAFERFTKKSNLPVRCGIEVKSVEKKSGRPGFRVETSQGAIEADYVIAATGAFQKPVIPAVVPDSTSITQIHSAGYRNPAQLPKGAVLVVGAGSSGAQIAEELLQAGRQVYISVGPHGRPPRRYRGRDNVWWLGVLGLWDLSTPPEGREHVTIAVSGAGGGKTVDFRQLASRGMTLLGRTETFKNGIMHFAADLADNIRQGDADYLSVLDDADAFVLRNGLDLPEEPEARTLLPEPACMTKPVLELNLAQAGITSIIWATGYSVDYSWLKLDVFDAKGKPRQQRGVTAERGIYFLGLPWLSRRGSTFIWGVWHDAKYLADHIATQRGYMDYKNSTGQRS